MLQKMTDLGSLQDSSQCRVMRILKVAAVTDFGCALEIEVTTNSRNCRLRDICVFRYGV